MRAAAPHLQRKRAFFLAHMGRGADGYRRLQKYRRLKKTACSSVPACLRVPSAYVHVEGASCVRASRTARSVCIPACYALWWMTVCLGEADHPCILVWPWAEGGAHGVCAGCLGL